ncbi:something about silencing protein 10 [Condylostylus longicornis]|uniref:something about silencing protein 10 n=1 Tax=Condylostylus longicornis TaxID=2530218 RepID=UPI00244E150F|nr:something about silencing protein 10 [Condylostylus longicornis]
MNIYNENKRVSNKNLEEELFEFDEEEDVSNPELSASDIEEEDVEDGIPDQKAWGKRRIQYYDADFIDKDYSTYTKEEEDLALAEEQEAQLIQERLAKELDEFDCDLQLPNFMKKDKNEREALETKLKVDFSNLSDMQKLQIFEKDSPEFDGLISDFQHNLNELKEFYLPLLKFAKLSEQNLPIFKILEVRESTTYLYLTNVAFYLYLKVYKIPFKGHPLVKKLAQIKQLLSELDKKIECFVPQLRNLIEKLESGEHVFVSPHKIVPIHTTSEINNSGESDNPEQDAPEESLDLRRDITYQIAKNKGLTPHRKKENRNPRVKHKMKFKKAIIRRKGATRTVRKETKRYDGEISGIKATVRKSIKFK